MSEKKEMEGSVGSVCSQVMLDEDDLRLHALSDDICISDSKKDVNLLFYFLICVLFLFPPLFSCGHAIL